MTDQVEYRRADAVPGLVLSEARQVGLRFGRHYHLDYHVGLVTAGVQRQHYLGETYRLGPGRICLMPPGDIHDGDPDSGEAYSLKTFRLSPALLASVTGEITGTPQPPALAGAVLDDPALAASLMRLHDALLGGDDTSPLHMQSAWLTLMERLFSRSRSVVSQAVKGALSPRQWEQVKAHCHAHLARKITLDELAALCGVDRFQFLKLFKQTVGMTPHAWLVRLRLEQACALLQRNGGSIAQVALEVGFYDQSHFNRAFRHAFGVAPSRY